MAISQPISTDKLNSPDHSLSHRVFANDTAAPVQSVTVDSSGNTTFHSNLLVPTGSGTLAISRADTVTVGPTGNYATLKEAVDWFNASATTDIEIRLDNGSHNITDTVTVNNASYNLVIRGLGINISTLAAAATGTYAVYTGTPAGCATEVTITADIKGTAGNVTLVQNGTTITALIAAWNAAHPANTLTLTAGDGGQTPSANVVLATGTGSALTGKPMFSIVTACDINRVTCDGSTLANYGTLAGEDCASYSTTQNLYSEVTDVVLNNFKIAINDTIGSDLFVFNFIISACGTGIAINYTSNSPTTSTNLDTEIGTFEHCLVGIDLIKTGAAKKAKFFLSSLIFTQQNASDIALRYDSANYVYGAIANFFNCSYNGVGSMTSGFDFSSATNANIIFIGNNGAEDSKPHAKINVYNNTSTTTVTASGTYYKAVYTNGSVYTTKMTLTNNKMLYQSDRSRDGLMWLSGAIQVNRNSATMEVAIRKEITVTSVVGNGAIATVTTTNNHGLGTGQQVQMLGWSSATFNGVKTITVTGDTTFTYANAVATTPTGGTCGALLSPVTVRGNATSSQPTTFSLNAYIEDIMVNDYFEIYVTCANSGDLVILSDVAWLFNTV